eukprot:Platyproteum_vivax@DN9237_c0_g1_i1.p1
MEMVGYPAPIIAKETLKKICKQPIVAYRDDILCKGQYKFRTVNLDSNSDFKEDTYREEVTCELDRIYTYGPGEDSFIIHEDFKLTFPIMGIEVSGKTIDQGWGNRRGETRICIIDHSNKEVFSCKLFDLIDHHSRKQTASFGPSNPLIKNLSFEKGDGIRIKFKIGGGGGDSCGHFLRVDDFLITFIKRVKCVDPIAPAKERTITR